MEEKVIEFIGVDSSNIAGVAHDEADQRMYVRFLSGKVYSYGNVSKEMFEEVKSARSVGGYLAKVFKQSDKYPYRGETVIEVFADGERVSLEAV